MNTTQYAIKTLLSAAVLAAVSELAKRSSTLAAVLASLPLVSVLAFVWMKLDGVPDARIGLLSLQIGVLVLPSLALFVILWGLLRHGHPFWPSLLLACCGTVLAYLLAMPFLKKLGLAA